MPDIFTATTAPGVKICDVAAGGSTGAQASFDVVSIFRQTGLAAMFNRIGGGLNDAEYRRPSVLWLNASQNATTSALKIEWSVDNVTWHDYEAAVVAGDIPINTATSFNDIVAKTTATTPDWTIGTLTLAATKAGGANKGWVKIPNPPPFIRVNVTALAASGSNSTVYAYAL